MFQDKQELVEEVRGIHEVKSMLRSSIKKYGKKIAEESRLEGIQEGILEGIKKGKLETAKNLLAKKVPVKEISEITGLSVEEIKKI